MVREQMQLKEEEVLTTFQSRFGRQEWLQPYTSETLKKLPSEFELTRQENLGAFM